MKLRLLLLLAVSASVVLAGTVAGSAAASNAPLRLSFTKTFDLPATIANGTPTWKGTVSGDVDGTLETRLVSATTTGSVEHIVFDWIVDAGDQSFTARMFGIYRTRDADVLMNGTITSGRLAGARIHEAAAAIGPGSWGGAILVIPAAG